MIRPKILATRYSNTSTTSRNRRMTSRISWINSRNIKKKVEAKREMEEASIKEKIKVQAKRTRAHESLPVVSVILSLANLGDWLSNITEELLGRTVFAEVFVESYDSKR
jgi:vacuolar-type H+-ATPase subunit E/Vma4